MVFQPTTCLKGDLMKNLFMALLVTMTATSAIANEGDLVLNGEKWIASFKNYNCVAFGAEVARPAGHEKFQVSFEKITTVSTLDNGLLKATFVEDGKSCRYNAFVFADNAAATMRLVESKAYAVNGDSDCAEGKALLDSNFESNNYLYWGHPHNLTVLIPVEGAEAVCGNGFVGVNFVVSGRVK